jgi:hypothetical protein
MYVSFVQGVRSIVAPKRQIDRESKKAQSSCRNYGARRKVRLTDISTSTGMRCSHRDSYNALLVTDCFQALPSQRLALLVEKLLNP